MYSLYKNNFSITSKGELDALINHCIKVSAVHIKCLHFSGKLYFSYDISYNDVAVDLIAEIFETKENVLINFRKFFASMEKIEDDNDFNKRLRFFLISIVNRNLVKFYKDNDPLGYKLIRNVDYAIETKVYMVTHLFTDKYVHRKAVDFNMQIIEKEKLINVLNSDSKILLTGTSFIDKLFDALESFDGYLHSLPYFDIISIYKELLVLNFFKSNGSGVNSHEYDKLNTVFLIKEAFENFKIKFDVYSNRVKLPEKTAIRFINIIEEIKDSYCNLSGKDSINNYITKNFKKHEMDSLHNKLEYCVSLFNNEILYLLRNEDVHERN